MFLNSMFSNNFNALSYSLCTSSSLASPSLLKSNKMFKSSALSATALKAFTQSFLILVFLRSTSAFLGSSQKFGARDFSSSSSISRSLRSRSKMPP
jgi:hypothetical protein